MTRSTGPFTQYNRAIIGKQPDDVIPNHKSMLGIFATYEALFLAKFVQLAEADGTSYA